MTPPNPNEPDPNEPDPNEPDPNEPSDPNADPPDPEDASVLLAQAQRQLAAAERRAVRAESKATQLEKATQSEAEKAAEARYNEGVAAGKRDGAARLVAAEFRAQGVNPATLDFMDLTRFVTEDGEPDQEAIEAAAETLKSGKDDSGAKPRVPVMPNGIQPGPMDDGDWLRSAMRKGG